MRDSVFRNPTNVLIVRTLVKIGKMVGAALAISLFIASAVLAASDTIIGSTTKTLDIRSAPLAAACMSESECFVFYLSSTLDAFAYKQSLDGGTTWGSEVSIYADASIDSLGMWSDAWTAGQATHKIHIIQADARQGVDCFVEYKNIDAETGVQSSSTIISGTSGASCINISYSSVSRAQSSSLYAIHAPITDGGSPFFKKSADEGATWVSKSLTGSGIDLSEPSGDRIQLIPGNTGSTDDVAAVYTEVNAETELWYAEYSASGDVWQSTQLMPDSAVDGKFKAFTAPTGVTYVAAANVTASPTCIKMWRIVDITDITVIGDVVCGSGVADFTLSWNTDANAPVVYYQLAVGAQWGIFAGVLSGATLESTQISDSTYQPVTWIYSEALTDRANPIVYWRDETTGSIFQNLTNSGGAITEFVQPTLVLTPTGKDPNHWFARTSQNVGASDEQSSMLLISGILLVSVVGLTLIKVPLIVSGGIAALLFLGFAAEAFLAPWVLLAGIMLAGVLLTLAMITRRGNE